MKRSEMIEIIAEALLTTVGLFGGAADEWEGRRDSSKLHRLKIAHNALKAAEENGMEYTDNFYSHGWDEEE